VPTATPSWIFEGGAAGAIANFKRVFGEAPEEFVDSEQVWTLCEAKCDTIDKQNAVARMLATNATVQGWNGKLE
jgi:hypothetical protein